MRCPNCQTINPPNAKFCLECGNRLLVCPNCGTVNLPFAKFCIECGTPLTAHSEDTTRGRDKSHPNNDENGHAVSPLPDTIPSTNAGGYNRIAPADEHKRAAASFEGNKSRRDNNGRDTSGPYEAPEERRVVTIMFADITGSTPLADRLDPEDMRAILSGYFNLMTQQIRRHGGTVEKYIGDAVMAVFGMPAAHEDDPDRAIRAALDMQAALRLFNTQRIERDPEAARLQMRIGINTGEVAAPGAQSTRQDFLITGDAVNVAARLQQAASPDTILVGERTYLTTRDVFDFRSIAPLNLKGKQELVAAWAVQGRRDVSRLYAQHPRGIEGQESPLVGRTLELTLIHTTYARVQAEQRPHLITLLGVPGIGKSRLARDFIRREEEASKSASYMQGLAAPRVLQGHCPPYGEGITYWPLVEILRSLLSVREGEERDELEKRLVQFVFDTLTTAKSSEDAAQIAGALIRSIGSGLSNNYDPQISGERHDIQRSTHSRSTEQGGPQAALMRAWRVFLEAIAEQGPLILVIDDMQWADEALLDLLEYLTDRITHAPILFLCPARPDFFERRRDWGGGRRNFTTIVLEALTGDETNDLITGLLETHDLPEVLYHSIQRRAEGNPFFVEEIVRMLIDQGVLVKQDGCWRISEQNEAALGELASPATPPDDTLIDQHYVLPLPRLPDTVQGVLAARIDLLSQVEKQVIQDAAIIGRTFWLEGLLELAADLEDQTVYTTVDTLIQRDFIVETEQSPRSPVPHDRTFSFKHILIRDVVYNNIPRTRRSQKHAQLAVWIEEKVGDKTDQFAELLAYHYKQALSTWSASLLARAVSNGEGKEAAARPVLFTRQELMRRTITYLTIAGDQAFRGYYTIRAIQAYTEALDLLIESDAETPAIARMHQKLGDAYAQRANADEAWHEYIHALQLIQAGDHVNKQDLLSYYTHHERTHLPPVSTGEAETYNNGYRKELLCLYTRMAELSTRWLGWFKRRPEIEEVQAYIEAGLKLLEGQPPNGDHAAFLTYRAMWYVRQLKDASPEKRLEMAGHALDSIHEALRIAEDVDDVSALWLTLDALGFIYEHQHRYLDAHEAQHRRQKLASRIHGREELHDLYASLGWTHKNISDYPAAAMWLGRAWRIAQTMESPSMLLYSMLCRMYVWYEWNRWDETREVAYQILQMTEQYQLDDQWMLDALETLADLSYRTGNIEESDSLLRQYKRLAEQRGFKPELTRSIYLAREEWERARADFMEALHRSEPFPSPAVLSLLAELVVITGESAATQLTLCERAVALAEQAGTRKYLAVALRARGRMYLEQQQWVEAEGDLKQALLHCELLDLPWERGQTLYCLGLYHRRHADIVNPGDAVEYTADLGRARLFFEQALGFFESLKAVHDAARVRLSLDQHEDDREPAQMPTTGA
ncbi:MAG TPA: adenylate/guanylate cyclase domain-containing protein [Ktedonobacteraceae bacterium]|nr:adenylate/guanylate cyclase domain-containing protein [Ktedonobacteraceae bacterium]